MNTNTARGWQIEATHILEITLIHTIIFLVENNVASYLIVTSAALREKQLIVRTELRAVIQIFLLSRHNFLLNCCDEADERYSSTLCHLPQIRPGNSAAFPIRLPELNNGNWSDDSWLVVKNLNGRGKIVTLDDTKVRHVLDLLWVPWDQLVVILKGQWLPEHCCRLFSSNYTTLCVSSGSFQLDNATCLKASVTSHWTLRSSNPLLAR